MQTPEPTLEALANRIEELERQCQRLKAEVATEKLILVDATGKTRAALRMLRKDSEPGLILYDAQGARRAELGMVIPEGNIEERPWRGLPDALQIKRVNVAVAPTI